MTAPRRFARHQIERRLATAAALATAALGLLVPATASADIVDASCTGTAGASFAPGLKLIPRSTTIALHASYGTCVSSSVASATTTGSATGTLSCLGGSATIDMWFQWKQRNGAGAESRVLMTLASVLGNGTVALTASGTVTNGLFAGDRYTAVFAAPFNPLACLSANGATSLAGLGDVTFTAPA